MSNLLDFAKKELSIIGMDENSLDIDLDMRNHILHMIEEFSQESHSGFSASYAISILEKLLKYQPLSPITGEDSEWTDVAEQSGYQLYQNKRCSSVFKSNGAAYDINGIIFYDVEKSESGSDFKSYFTNVKSRVEINFPYTQNTIYQEREKNNEFN
jgi:hypothetical protein